MNGARLETVDGTVYREKYLIFLRDSAVNRMHNIIQVICSQLTLVVRS